MKAKCIRTCIFEDGEESFTRGETYRFAKGQAKEIGFKTVLIDNQKQNHTLAEWWRYFKLVES